MKAVIEWIGTYVAGDRFQALLAAVVLLVATLLVSRLSSRVLKRLLRSDDVPLPSSSILVNIARAVVWVIGLSIILSACFGVDVNGLVAALGVGGIALSLGLQDLIKNFIGGLQITLMRIVEPGDHVIVGSTEGIVQDVSWRQTVVKDYENNTHIIPNAEMSATEVVQVKPERLVSTIVVFNNDGRSLAQAIPVMERLAKEAIEQVTPLERDPWLLITHIGEYGIWAKLRFVLQDVALAREARSAAMIALSPFTRNDVTGVMAEADGHPDGDSSVQ